MSTDISTKTWSTCRPIVRQYVDKDMLTEYQLMVSTSTRQRRTLSPKDPRNAFYTKLTSLMDTGDLQKNWSVQSTLRAHFIQTPRQHGHSEHVCQLSLPTRFYCTQKEIEQGKYRRLHTRSCNQAETSSYISPDSLAASNFLQVSLTTGDLLKYLVRFCEVVSLLLISSSIYQFKMFILGNMITFSCGLLQILLI